MSYGWKVQLTATASSSCILCSKATDLRPLVNLELPLLLLGCESLSKRNGSVILLPGCEGLCCWSLRFERDGVLRCAEGVRLVVLDWEVWEWLTGSEVMENAVPRWLALSEGLSSVALEERLLVRTPVVSF